MIVISAAAASGCGSAAHASGHRLPVPVARVRGRRRLRHPLRLPSHVELRRHPRAVVELRGSGAVRHRPPARSARLAEDAITGVRSSRRMVALSFDDGPSERYTPAVLTLLREFGAHATFFAIGRNALAHPALVRDELAAGDEVGEHSFDHPHLPALPARAISLELADGTRADRATGGAPVRLFRPPFGQFDARVARAAARLRQRIVLWSLNLERLEQLEGARAAAGTVLRRVRPGDIILCHDGVPPGVAALAARFLGGRSAMVRNRRVSRSQTLVALPLLLAGLHERGYRVVTVSTLLSEGRPIQQGLDAIDDPWAYRHAVHADRRPAER